MCRLYAMHANEPTRVECSLIKAQNALMEQSKEDSEGFMHGHGWGVADYSDGVPIVEKRTWAAFHGEHFSKKASCVYAKTVVAHVRRATVGAPSIENTHPFENGKWIFAHNGTVPNFARVRDKMIRYIDPLHRNEINGETDSEHIFRYLLTLWSRDAGQDLLKIVRAGLQQIVRWSWEIDPEKKVGLNIILTDGDQLVGSRMNRTLWYLERDHTFRCPICGKPHVHHQPKRQYRAFEVASEPITSEQEWKMVPENTVFAIDDNYKFRSRALMRERLET